MATNRISKINEEIQRELSAILREVKDPRVCQAVVTVTAVETTGDLKYAKVFVSTLQDDKRTELLRGLKSASGFIRGELGRRLNLRAVPLLVFRSDESIRYGAHINDILREMEP